MERTTNKDLFSRIEPFVFFLAVCANLAPLFVRKFFPFTDAPSHIYNADLLNQLVVAKDQFLGEYIQVNDVIVPNWFSEFLMFPLLNFFEPDVVEKMYLVVYFAGLPLAMRYCLNCIAPTRRYLAFLAIPITYNSLSMISFYNFSSGLIFLLLIVGFFFKHFSQGEPRARHYIILFLLFLMAYFCHLVVMVIALVYVAIIYTDTQYGAHGFKIKEWLNKQLLFIVLSVLPAILLLCVYFVKKHTGNTVYEYLEPKTLLNYFLDAQPYVAFGTAENAAAGVLGWVIMVSVILSMYLQFGLKMQRGNKIFTWIGLIAVLILYLALPNSDNVGGYVSVRLSLIFYLMSILFIAAAQLRRTYLLSIIVISLVVQWFRVSEYATNIKWRNEQVSRIRDQAAFIEPNSFVYTFHCNDDWLAGHYGNYVCLGRPGVIAFQNYECNIGYFPLTWKDRDKILKLVGRLEYFMDLENVKTELHGRPIYMWVYGDLPSQTQENYVNLRHALEKTCVLLNSNPYASLYRLK